MANTLQEEASIARLEQLIKDYNYAKSRPYSNLSLEELQQFTTRSIAAVDQIAGRGSIHYEHVRSIGSLSKAPMERKVALLIGVVEALAVDLRGGFLQRHVTLIRGEVFGDFLENGYALGRFKL